jgi:hypothetical protein
MDLSALIPLGNRARLAVAFLAVTAVLDVVAIWFDLWEIRVIDDFVADPLASTDALSSSDSRQQVIGLLVVLAFIATAIVFIRWLHAAYKNIVTLGAGELRFTPGWTIGAWFVPFLNLWRPKQIVDDIWRASDPAAPPRQGIDWRGRRTSALLTAWWVFWILTSTIGNASARILFAADTLDDFRHSAQVDAANSVLDMVAAILAILVVRRVTARQHEREERLRSLAPLPTPML